MQVFEIGCDAEKCKFLNLRERVTLFDPYKRSKMKRKDKFINFNEII